MLIRPSERRILAPARMTASRREPPQGCIIVERLNGSTQPDSHSLGIDDPVARLGCIATFRVVAVGPARAAMAERIGETLNLMSVILRRRRAPPPG